MDEPTVTVRFRRTGDTYAVNIELDQTIVFAAINISYADMLREVSAQLRSRPNCTLIFERSDPGAVTNPWIAEPNERDLIRDQVDRYISANTGYDRSVVVRESGELLIPTTDIAIRTGYDTLAETFGDCVYVRYRDDGAVECPLCGRWHASVRTTEYNDGTVTGLYCRCWAFGNSVIMQVERTGSWIELPVRQLLGCGVNRFYLPRAWNSDHWIRADDLSDRFVRFEKEKANV